MYSTAFAISTVYQQLSSLLFSNGYNEDSISKRGYLFNRDSSITITVSTGSTIPTGKDGLTIPPKSAIKFGSETDLNKIWVLSASGTPTLEVGIGVEPPVIPLTTNTLGVAVGTSLAVSGALSSSSPTAGIGYATGAGGAVTQGTSRTTGVTINTPSGAITLFSAAGSATPFSFTVTNSSVAATDVVKISQKSGTDKYTTQEVTATGAGSFQITLANASGTTTEQPVFNFVIIKAVSA